MCRKVNGSGDATAHRAEARYVVGCAQRTSMSQSYSQVSRINQVLTRDRSDSKSRTAARSINSEEGNG